MHKQYNLRFWIESGMLVSAFLGAVYIGVLGYKVDAMADDLSEQKTEYKILAKDLVETQKKMLVDITEIKTIISNGGKNESRRD